MDSVDADVSLADRLYDVLFEECTKVPFTIRKEICTRKLEKKQLCGNFSLMIFRFRHFVRAAMNGSLNEVYGFDVKQMRKKDPDKFQHELKRVWDEALEESLNELPLKIPPEALELRPRGVDVGKTLLDIQNEVWNEIAQEASMRGDCFCSLSALCTIVENMERERAAVPTNGHESEISEKSVDTACDAEIGGDAEIGDDGDAETAVAAHDFRSNSEKAFDALRAFQTVSDEKNKGPLGVRISQDGIAYGVRRRKSCRYKSQNVRDVFVSVLADGWARDQANEFSVTTGTIRRQAELRAFLSKICAWDVN